MCYVRTKRVKIYETDTWHLVNDPSGLFFTVLSNTYIDNLVHVSSAIQKEFGPSTLSEANQNARYMLSKRQSASEVLSFSLMSSKGMEDYFP